MKVQEPDDEGPVSWKTILAEMPVFSSDDDEVGTVHEVLGSEQEDIFHGIVVRSGLLGKDVVVVAQDVTGLGEKRIDLALSAEQVRALEPFKEEESYHLGIVGLFRHRVGWVPESRDPE
jgi:PRC-barrel domain